MAPVRIRLSRARGWRLPDGAVSVARPGKWGNPFVVGRDGTRLQCVAMFVLLYDGFIALHGNVDPDDQLRLWKRLRQAKKELEGRDLACWCSLDGPCHADVLLWIANDGVPFALAGREIEMPRVRLGMDAKDMLRLQAKRKRLESAQT